MSSIGEWGRRVRRLMSRRKFERELQREMEAHRDMMREPRRFGNMLRLREESRDVWGWNRVEDAYRDLKIAARTLRQSPGFTIGATLVLSVGIGLNVTLFQIYNMAVLQPLDVRDPGSIVELHRFRPRGPIGALPYPAIEYVRDNNKVFSAVLVSARQRYVLWGNGEERLAAHFVSMNWFDELGIRAAAGRVFQELIDGRLDAAPVVILSHYFWTNHLSGDPNVIGSTIRINDRPATIVGILAPDYRGLELDDARMWLPIEQIDYFFPGLKFTTAWEGATLVKTFARLKPGVSLTAARESLRPLVNELALQQPERFLAGEWLEPYPASRMGYEDPRQRRERLLGVSGIAFLSLLVLTIACANLSNMVLSRSITRLRELNIRVAIGAGRWRVMRLLMGESALLAGLATIAAFAMSSATLKLAAEWIQAPIHPATDWRTIIAALSVAGFAIFVIGFLPTWSVSRRDLVGAIKDGQHLSESAARSRLRSLLTAVQVGGSCILLLLAALTARDVQHALRPGFDLKNVAILDVAPLAGHKIDPTYWERLRRAIAALPETEAVAFATSTPMGAGVRSVITNVPESPGLVIVTNSVEPQFFNVMRIPIVVGRTFEGADDPQTTMIISRRLAQKIYGTLNVVGRQFPRPLWKSDKGIRRTIVGVAEDANPVLLEFPHSGTEYAELYTPISSAQRTMNTDLLVRARSDANALLGPMRDASRAIDKQLFVQARLLSADFARQIRQLGNLSVIALSLAGVTLLLACVGIFGVMSYGARVRRKELSIRLAVGAAPWRVAALLIKDSSRPAAAGMLLAIALGVAAARLLESAGIYLGSIDASVLISVISLISLTCLTATALPAIRAIRIDIAETLRNE